MSELFEYKQKHAAFEFPHVMLLRLERGFGSGYEEYIGHRNKLVEYLKDQYDPDQYLVDFYPNTLYYHVGFRTKHDAMQLKLGFAV